jgi:hypothetical protein
MGMADILVFPRKPRIRQSTVISLYTDEEIELTIAAINLHGINMGRATEDLLKSMDAESVEYCLRQASVNQLLSSRARRLALHILGTIQHVNIRQKM